MGRYIVKLDKYYFEWSTVVDAPVTYGLEKDDFLAYYKEEYGRAGMTELPARLERVELRGHSAMVTYGVDDLIADNRAGDNEECLSKEEIIAKFVIGGEGDER